MLFGKSLSAPLARRDRLAYTLVVCRSACVTTWRSRVVMLRKDGVRRGNRRAARFSAAANSTTHRRCVRKVLWRRDDESESRHFSFLAALVTPPGTAPVSIVRAPVEAANLAAAFKSR